VGFLNHEFRLVNRISHPLEYYCKIFDTLTFARELHPGQRNSLDALCKRYSIDNSDRNFHGALLDAKILAGVYLAMTGGQDLLFSDLPKANQQNDGAEQKALSLGKTWDLTLIHASIDEVKSHDDYLQSLSKKSDEVIWK